MFNTDQILLLQRAFDPIPLELLKAPVSMTGPVKTDKHTVTQTPPPSSSSSSRCQAESCVITDPLHFRLVVSPVYLMGGYLGSVAWLLLALCTQSPLPQIAVIPMLLTVTALHVFLLWGRGSILSCCLTALLCTAWSTLFTYAVIFHDVDAGVISGVLFSLVQGFLANMSPVKVRMGRAYLFIWTSICVIGTSTAAVVHFAAFPSRQCLFIEVGAVTLQCSCGTFLARGVKTTVIFE